MPSSDSTLMLMTTPTLLESLDGGEILPRNSFLDGTEASLCAALERKMLETQVKIGVGTSQSLVLADAVREAMGSALRGLEEHAPHWLFITATDNYDADGGLQAIVALCKDLITDFCESGGGTDAEQTETQFHATTTCRAVLNGRQGFVSASPSGDKEAKQGSALGVFCIWNPRHVLDAARPHLAAGNFAVVSCDQEVAAAKESNKHFYGNIKKTRLTELKHTLIEQARIESRRDNAKRLLAYGQADVGRFVDIWDQRVKRRGRIVKFEKTGRVSGTHSVMFGKQMRDVELHQMESLRFVMVPPEHLTANDSTRLPVHKEVGNDDEESKVEPGEAGEMKKSAYGGNTEIFAGLEDEGGSDLPSFLGEAGLSEFYGNLRVHGVRSCAELFDPDVVDDALLASPAIGMAPNQRNSLFETMERQVLDDSVLWVSTTPGLEQTVLDLIASIFPPSVKVVGGTAADNDLAGSWSVCSGNNTDAIRNGFVVSGLQLNLEMKPVFLNTYIPVPRSEGNIVSSARLLSTNANAEGTTIEQIRDGGDDATSLMSETNVQEDGRVASTSEDAARVYRRWVRNFTGSSDRLPEVASVQAQSNERSTLQRTAVYPLGLRVASSGDPNVDFVNTWPSAMYRVLSDGPELAKKSVEVIDLNVQWGKIRSLLGSVTLMQATEASLANLGDGIWENLNRNERRMPQPMGALAVYSGGALQNLMRSFRGSVVDDLCQSVGASLHGAPFLIQFSYGEQGFHSGCLKTMHSNLMASALVFVKRPRTSAGGDLDEVIARASYYVQSDQGRSMCEMMGFGPHDMGVAVEVIRLLGSDDGPPLELHHVQAFIRCFGIDILEDVLLGSKFVLGRSLEVAPHLRTLARREPHKAKLFVAHAKRIGGLSMQLLDILCEIYGDADAMWLICADPYVASLNVDEQCDEHQTFLASRVVQEVLDECFSRGDVFYSRVGEKGGSRRKAWCGVFAPRGNLLLRAAAHVVSTALLAFGTLNAKPDAKAMSRSSYASAGFVAFVLGTLMATLVTCEDVGSTFHGYSKVPLLGWKITVPRFRYNATYTAFQCVGAAAMIFSCIVGRAPIAMSVVLFLQVAVFSKFTALHATLGPLQAMFASLVREIFALLALLLLLAAACALALVSLNAPESGAPHEYRAFLPCLQLLVGSALLGGAGVFEAGSDHHDSAMLLLPDRDDYDDAYRHALTHVYVYGFFAVASLLLLNALLGLFARSFRLDVGGSVASHTRAFLMRRWFYAMDYKSRRFVRGPEGGTGDPSRSPSPIILAAAGHMADGSNRKVSISVAVRQLRRLREGGSDRGSHHHDTAAATQQTTPHAP